MKYRAVGNRCAVYLQSLKLPIPDAEALLILEDRGFKVLEVNLIALARQCIKISTYHRGAKFTEAPIIVDCSSFIKWLYGQQGIWLPRRSIQQREFGVSVPINKIYKGDVVFVSGLIDYYYNDPSNGVGHVGIATGEGTIIHVANREANIIESSLENFASKTKFRGIKRYVPKDKIVLTLEIPVEQEVETVDDLRWIVLQSLPKK